MYNVHACARPSKKAPPRLSNATGLSWVSPLGSGWPPLAWAFGSRCRSEHVTISVLGTGATGSSIFSFLTSTLRRAFGAPKRTTLPILKPWLLIWARARVNVSNKENVSNKRGDYHGSEKFTLANLQLE